jgi:molecular chaperone GrpE
VAILVFTEQIMANEQGSDDDQVQVIDAADPMAETGAGTSGAGGDVQPQSHEALLLSLQDAQAKADEHWNQLLLARADMSNMQRRAERELENAHKYGLERFVRELLPVKDSLEMGLQATEGEETDPAKVREGVEMTLKLLAGAVEKFGVTEINPVGEAFNPDFHQAMTTQPGGDDVEPNTVLTVFQKGYLLNDRLIRPAMVVVAK